MKRLISMVMLAFMMAGCDTGTDFNKVTDEYRDFDNKLHPIIVKYGNYQDSADGLVHAESVSYYESFEDLKTKASKWKT